MNPFYLLDTNVLSEVMRPQPAAPVLDWLARQEPGRLHTSTITVAEIQAGLALLPDGQRQRALQQAAAALFEQDFSGRIWPFDLSAAQHYAVVKAQRQRLGRPIAHADAQIAALAMARRATLVTRNTADFDSIPGLMLLNPWVPVHPRG